MNFRTPQEWDITPFRVALLYLLFGFSALVVSDVLLPLAISGSLLRTIQSVKGALEILLTAVFIYLVIEPSWRDLRLKERAMDAAPVGITISDPAQDDNPVIFANQRFESLTGYDTAEVLGRNCRFLQGDETDPETVATLRTAIKDQQSVSVDIRNYRKNGEMFWNKLDIAPVRDKDGNVTNYVGFQTDITERKLDAERLEVLNRILRHNFRNRMNVIEGYLSLLKDDLDEADDYESIEKIDTAVSDLLSLIETTRQTESIFQAVTARDQPVTLDDHVLEIVDALSDKYSDATITLTLETDGLRTDAVGISNAIAEAIENAIKHNDSGQPEVAVRLMTSRDGWATVEIEDNGPGIPENEFAVLKEGETPLTHGTHMGLWMIHWIVRRAGGSLTVADTDETGTVLRLSIPTLPPE